MALTQISTQGIKDGTITGSDLATNVDLVNNQKLRLGTGNDLQIYHDGTNSFIVNNDGDLLIRNTTGNEIKIQAVSGEQSIQCIGDGAVELYFDGSKKFETTSGGAELPDGSVLTVQTTSTSNGFLSFLDIGNVGYEWKFPDNSTVQFGTNHGSDKRLQLNNEDASSHFHFSLADNGKMLFGNNDDLQIFHDGTSSILKNTTGGLFVQSDDTRITNAANSETIARFIADGAVELYYDSSKKFETTSLGATLTGRLISDGLDVGDSESLRLGNNYDLQIFHDGTSSLIKSSSHPIAHYSNTRHHFLNGDGSENMAVFVADGQCELYHNNSKKFQTESYGVQVFGNLFIADGGSGAGDNRIDIGNGSDFMIFHDGSTNIIDGRFHPIELRHQTEVHIKCVDDGAVELYHNNSKKFETTSNGATVSVASGDPQLIVTGPGHALLQLTSTSGTDHCGVNFGDNDDNNAGMIQYTNSTNIMQFHTNGSERMRIESTGAIRSGTSSVIQAEKFTWFRPESDANTLAYFHQGASANVTGIIMRHGRGLSGFSGKMLGFLRNDGTEVGSVVIGNSSTAFNTSSDYRLKENVTLITDGITRLKTLKPYRFNFKDDTTKPIVDGFFAHEVTAVPEAITGTKDEVDADNNPVYQSIDQSKLVPLLVAALQETINKVEVLETEVAALKAS